VWYTHRPDDAGSKYLWNVGELVLDYTALQPRRQPSSYSPPWEPQILQLLFLTPNFRLHWNPFSAFGYETYGRTEGPYLLICDRFIQLCAKCSISLQNIECSVMVPGLSLHPVGWGSVQCGTSSYCGRAPHSWWDAGCILPCLFYKKPRDAVPGP
jgi:hypothetical protein